MNKLSKLRIFAAGFVLATGFYALNYVSNSKLRAVQAGEIRLVCFMKSGDQIIKPSQVVGLVDGVWLFENGHARNCEVIE